MSDIQQCLDIIEDLRHEVRDTVPELAEAEERIRSLPSATRAATAGELPAWAPESLLSRLQRSLDLLVVHSIVIKNEERAARQRILRLAERRPKVRRKSA